MEVLKNENMRNKKGRERTRECKEEVCVCVYIYIYIYICVCMVYVYMYVCMYVCMHAYTCKYMCTCLPRLIKQYSPLEAIGINLSNPGNPSTFKIPEDVRTVVVYVHSRILFLSYYQNYFFIR